MTFTKAMTDGVKAINSGDVRRGCFCLEAARELAETAAQRVELRDLGEQIRGAALAAIGRTKATSVLH